MDTYLVTLQDRSILKTVAPSKAKARANVAHRLSHSMGHKRAYALIESVRRFKDEPGMPIYKRAKDSGSRVKSEPPSFTQTTLPLNFISHLNNRVTTTQTQ